MRQTIKRYSLWYLIEGVLLVVAGIMAVIYPVVSSLSVVVLLGWLLIISGVLQGISLIGAGQVPHFWLQLISVILAVLVGLLFLRDPAQGLLTITLLLIIFFMIEGISKVIFSLTIRPFPNWGCLAANRHSVSGHCAHAQRYVPHEAVPAIIARRDHPGSTKGGAVDCGED